ncbi:unnamed protein product [Allacma fusca]|uniref:Uncharacterized protein n=1 Tax=Allacma fusca TaxID=39272 RepID=A0A8J2P2I3_9HEXA|nr:unnamed protein product [Allacma fusca]
MTYSYRLVATAWAKIPLVDRKEEDKVTRSNYKNWDWGTTWLLLISRISILCVSLLLVLIFLAFNKENDRYYRTCKISTGLRITRTQSRRFSASTLSLSTFDLECAKIGGVVTLVSESKQKISLNNKGYQTLLKQLRKKRITLEDIGLQPAYIVQQSYKIRPGSPKAPPITYTVYLSVNFANKLLFFGPATSGVLQEAKTAITREAWDGIIWEMSELHGEIPKAVFKNYILF